MSAVHAAVMQAAADVPLGSDGSVEPLLADDPWWLGLIKALMIFVILLLLTLFAIWFERKVVGRMQHRPGPNWNGPFGLLQSLADALKLHFKEGIIPARADKVVYILAPAFAAIPAFLIFSIIPVGGEVTMFGEQTALQLIDPPVGVLVALALASIGVYGIVLGGWASGSTYPLLGSLRSAWSLERRRLARRGRHPFRPGNDVLNAWLMSAVLWGAMVAVLGWQILPLLVVQAVVGFTLLEVVNYMEHYGMLRQKVGVGHRQRYERVDPSHSWNSNNIATNVLLDHLQRHSDHHANPTRRYQTLRDFEESPVLPTGYAGMIVLAVVPPLWRRVMDPRVLAHFDGDITRANIQPRKRERILAAHALEVSEAEAAAQLRADEALLAAAALAEVEVLAARCPGCSYVYEVEVGNELEGFAAGTAWKDIPDDWCCPDCGVREKVDFVPLDPNQRVA